MAKTTIVILGIYHTEAAPYQMMSQLIDRLRERNQRLLFCSEAPSDVAFSEYQRWLEDIIKENQRWHEKLCAKSNSALPIEESLEAYSDQFTTYLRLCEVSAPPPRRV